LWRGNKKLACGQKEKDMTKRFSSVALLILALLLIAPAMAWHPVAGAAVGFATLFYIGAPRPLRHTFKNFLVSELGVQTINYLDPGTGTTAPTQVQAAGIQAQTLQVGASDTEVSITVTHNWSFTAAQLAKGFPFIQHWQETLGAPGTGLFTFTRGANTIVIGKASGTGSGGTWTFVLQRPFSALMQ
jgi:hypothetical protein